MKKMIAKHLFLAGVAVISAVGMLPSVAYAQGNSEQGKQNAAEHKELAQNKLSDGKLRSCQNRQQAITNILLRIADRGQKQIYLFSTIAQRTENFYADRGLTLSNYD